MRWSGAKEGPPSHTTHPCIFAHDVKALHEDHEAVVDGRRLLEALAFDARAGGALRSCRRSGRGPPRVVLSLPQHTRQERACQVDDRNAAPEAAALGWLARRAIDNASWCRGIRRHRAIAQRIHADDKGGVRARRIGVELRVRHLATRGGEQKGQQGRGEELLMHALLTGRTILKREPSFMTSSAACSDATGT